MDQPWCAHKQIGRGRAAVVYIINEAGGETVVHKVFEAGGTAKLVQFVLSGAPNPYGWNPHAIASAVARREILDVLVRFWFGNRLRLPKLRGSAWNESRRAYELRTELIDGVHLPLCPNNSGSNNRVLDELTEDIMRPLRRYLIDAGFDGLVWQAGHGNPVAGGNFMIEHGTGGRRNWVWIDLESGVPALFPLNLLTLFTFYLPRSVHHGRPLFDDVDVPKLRRYLAAHGNAIDARCGAQSVAELTRRVDELARSQAAWKSLTRSERGVAYFRATGRLNDAQAAWYLEHPTHWHGRLAVWFAQRLLRAAVGGVRRVARWLGQTDWPALARDGRRLLVSRRFREHLARRYVSRRLRDWRDRRFLSPLAARRLRAELRTQVETAHLADFGLHLAIKPFVKALQWCLFPVLFFVGVLAAPVWLAAIAALGSICRTLYTAGRCVQAIAGGRRPPWVALVVGLLPGFGNAAFPAQIVFDARRSGRDLAQFILYDTFACLGRAIPVWGGADSLIEARMNRLPDLFVPQRFESKRAVAALGLSLEQSP